MELTERKRQILKVVVEDYIRSAEAVLPGRRRLELCYEHECFEGETLTLLRSGDIVQGVKPDGTESFRARLWEELA